MKKLLILFFIMTMLATMAQNTDKNPKDLWTRSVDVSLGDNWRQKNISVPGKGIPDVVDFFRAFAKAYPCEYHDLLVMALDGDEEVLFNHSKPYIRIDDDSCLMENGSFSMRVFYNGDQPAALGVCCHKAITTELQDAYYYRYNHATRKLTPLAQGSDFTGGIVKRQTLFFPQRHQNYATMTHRWGRCGIDFQLVWSDGKFTIQDPAKKSFMLPDNTVIVMSLMQEVLQKYEMELREPKHNVDPSLEGGDYNSLPICVAILDEHSGGNYVEASAMEGFYYFYARGWKRNDGNTLVAVYTRCAPNNDHFVHKNEAGEYITTYHELKAGDEVSLNFYLCNEAGAVSYLDSSSKEFASKVGKAMPALERNEWHCVLAPDNEDLVFVNEADGHQKVYRWDGMLLRGQ